MLLGNFISDNYYLQLLNSNGEYYNVLPVSSPYRSRTLQFMACYDYFANSQTGISSGLSFDELRELNAEYGSMLTPGMTTEYYRSIMDYMWEDFTEYDKEPEYVNVDLTQIMDYDTYVSYLKKLSTYDGVYLYKIGTSTEGRDMFAVEVDFDSEYDKEVICLTGQTHSREFAGSVFIVKSLFDLVESAQTDEKIYEMLLHYKYAAVPCISLDVREELIYTPELRTENGILWKACANGTDLNRNMPAADYRMLDAGIEYNGEYDNPGLGDYAGEFAASTSEARAMTKWFYHYVGVEGAILHLDYHEQGRLLYVIRGWEPDSVRSFSLSLADKIQKHLGAPYWISEPDQQSEWLGDGATMTDFASCIALGGKFSSDYGFFVFTEDGREIPAIATRKLSEGRNFSTITIEMCSGKSALGCTETSRSLIAQEYTKYHFDTLLFFLPYYLGYEN